MVVALLSLGAFSGVPGCAPKPEVVEWAPGPKVTWPCVTTAPVPLVTNGYRILVRQPTSGLFPASMAVTRVALQPSTDEGSRIEANLYADPKNEFLQWNRTLDDQMAVSEVFPIIQRDLGGGEVSPEQVLAACRALHARLGLIYAVNELTPVETEMFGTLYDATTTKPIAVLHAYAVSVPPPPGEEDKKPKDLWKVDSRALVRAKFEQYVHACLRELIIHDEREVTEAPAGWTPLGPVRPVEWPPPPFRPGRRR